ncbi:23S rRNA (uridine(2552)-2'-O)-methyltransferase RlmE [Perlucidibaca piscinae]|uniref:23S rRNA (uridine(2552)-2'-O)-methyltransferase RlmE n=1 Tax=Perlucidibaca piscinae TaxID=392589 RepID=UPI0003B48A4D|nr:23S rRNA (uridine(2552)-2'-O)-methyltransferase RlmE [Perlucidibaca piscinae]
MATRITNHKLSGSSKTWMKEHLDDPYVQRAWKDGYRSRASYKLLEIQDKDKLIKPGMHILDLGAAPGGWCQVAGRLIGDRGRVVATDILPMDALPDVTFVQGDFREQNVLDEILSALDGQPVDLVICDMAPNMSGNNAVDQPRAMYLCELALDMAVRVLKPGGAFVVKVFLGEGYEAYRAQIREHFPVLKARKPDASRARSREVYLVATGFKP